MSDLVRRVKCLRIGDTFLPVIFGKNVAPYRISQSPLPDDAIVVRCEMEFGWSFKLLIQSAEFDPVPEGGRIPEIMPVLTRIDIPGNQPDSPPVKFREFI